jgi:hypothetical protein
MAAPVFNTNDVPDANQVNSWFVNVLFARKTADETITSNATLQDDNDLFVTVEANAIYHTLVLVKEVSQATDDFKTGFTGPSGYSFSGEARAPRGDAAGNAEVGGWDIGAGAHGIAFGGAAGFNLPVHLEGILITAGTAGTFRLQWAQSSASASGTTVRAGSFMILRRVS